MTPEQFDWKDGVRVLCDVRYLIKEFADVSAKYAIIKSFEKIPFAMAYRAEVKLSC
jgi:hypothetical protein